MKETSVHNPESCEELIQLGETEVCKCKNKLDCNSGISYKTSIKCEFSEENPVCPFRPRCLGCNYMFSPRELRWHVKDTPKCYDAYSPAAYNQVVHFSCYEDGCVFSKENPICPNYKTCQGCMYMFKFDKMEMHLKEREPYFIEHHGKCENFVD